MWLLGSWEEDLSRSSWSLLYLAPGLVLPEVPLVPLDFVRRRVWIHNFPGLKHLWNCGMLAHCNLVPWLLGSAQPWLCQFWSFSVQAGLLDPFWLCAGGRQPGALLHVRSRRTAGYLEASSVPWWLPRKRRPHIVLLRFFHRYLVLSPEVSLSCPSSLLF